MDSNSIDFGSFGSFDNQQDLPVTGNGSRVADHNIDSTLQNASKSPSHSSAAPTSGAPRAAGGDQQQVDQLEDDGNESDVQVNSAGSSVAGSKKRPAPPAVVGDAPEKKKRVRQALSCTFCQRRKQKCDKKVPCINCIKRNRPELCVIETRSGEPDKQVFASAQEVEQLRNQVAYLDSVVTQLKRILESTGFTFDNDATTRPDAQQPPQASTSGTSAAAAAPLQFPDTTMHDQAATMHTAAAAVAAQQQQQQQDQDIPTTATKEQPQPTTTASNSKADTTGGPKKQGESKKTTKGKGKQGGNKQPRADESEVAATLQQLHRGPKASAAGEGESSS